MKEGVSGLAGLWFRLSGSGRTVIVCAENAEAARQRCFEIWGFLPDVVEEAY